MPRDSAGVFSLPPNSLAISGQVIQPSTHNTPIQDIADALTGSLPRNGTAPMTGPLDMGSQRIKAVADATAGTDALNQQTGDARYAPGHGQCRLNYVSATAVRLDPLGGNKLIINGTMQTVPAAGVTLANTGLLASTVYYVYAYWTGSAIALEASATGHSADATTGVEIKTGDATRTLVGMVRTTGTSQFQDDPTFRGVASWFNRRPRACRTVWTGAQLTISATAAQPIANSLAFLCWADAATQLAYAGTWDLADNGASAFTFNGTFWVDGSVGTATYGYGAYYSGTIGNFFADVSLSFSGEMTEAFHTVLFSGWVSGGSAGSVGNPILHGVVFI